MSTDNLKRIKNGNKNKFVHIKMSEEDHALMKEKADLHTRGNLSAWIRYAGKHCEPKESDLEAVSSSS